MAHTVSLYSSSEDSAGILIVREATPFDSTPLVLTSDVLRDIGEAADQEDARRIQNERMMQLIQSRVSSSPRSF